MQKYYIEKLTKKKFAGQNGDFWTLNVKCNGQWFSGYLKEWNKGWEEGQTVEFDWKESDKKDKYGNAYKNIVDQSPQRQGGGGMDLKPIHDKLDQILKLLQTHGFLEEEPPMPGENDAPPEEELPY